MAQRPAVPFGGAGSWLRAGPLPQPRTGTGRVLRRVAAMGSRRVKGRSRARLLSPTAACEWCCWPLDPAPEDSRVHRHARRCLGRQLPLAAELQIDHIVPLARGGRHTQDNLRVLCSRCNVRKGQQTDEESGGAPRIVARRLAAVNQTILLAQRVTAAFHLLPAVD